MRIKVRDKLGLFEKQDPSIESMERRYSIKMVSNNAARESEIMNLLDKSLIYDAFEKINEFRLESAQLYQLKNEFIGGQHDVNFIHRLKMCVKLLLRPS
jgi:hypothetical protein